MVASAQEGLDKLLETVVVVVVVVLHLETLEPPEQQLSHLLLLEDLEVMVGQA